MANNARGHTIPDGTALSVNRATIFEGFGNSIRDVVPVANVTERSQLVAALTAVGEAPDGERPLVVHRLDAAGMHRVESTVDGVTWVPASGVLRFATVDLRNDWTASNGSLLSAGDECAVGTRRYSWTGTNWLPVFALVSTTSTHALTNGTVSIAWVDPASAGVYGVDTDGFWSSGATNRFTFPYAGFYRIGYTIRTNGVNPISVTPFLNAVQLPYGLGSGVGTSGAATQATKVFPLRVAAGDYLTISATSTGGAAGAHVCLIELIGGV